jgi:hypothetical protein
LRTRGVRVCGMRPGICLSVTPADVDRLRAQPGNPLPANLEAIGRQRGVNADQLTRNIVPLL